MTLKIPIKNVQQDCGISQYLGKWVKIPEPKSNKRLISEIRLELSISARSRMLGKELCHLTLGMCKNQVD